jgi:hypothetical protein
VFNFVLLGWLGSQPVEYPFVDLSQLASKFHFLYFLFFIPYSNFWDLNMNVKFLPFNFITNLIKIFRSYAIKFHKRFY